MICQPKLATRFNSTWFVVQNVQTHLKSQHKRSTPLVFRGVGGGCFHTCIFNNVMGSHTPPTRKPCTIYIRGGGAFGDTLVFWCSQLYVAAITSVLIGHNQGHKPCRHITNEKAFVVNKLTFQTTNTQFVHTIRLPKRENILCVNEMYVKKIKKHVCFKRIPFQTYERQSF